MLGGILRCQRSPNDHPANQGATRIVEVTIGQVKKKLVARQDFGQRAFIPDPEVDCFGIRFVNAWL
jgi:hypothetical protein